MESKSGSLEVITGSMFCGKTDELIRRLRRAKIAKQKVQVFKPKIDNRYAEAKVTSHAGSEFDAVPIDKAADIRANLDPDTTVVAIDETQFLDGEIVSASGQIAEGQELSRGRRVAPGGIRQFSRQGGGLQRVEALADQFQDTAVIKVVAQHFAE